MSARTWCKLMLGLLVTVIVAAGLLIAGASSRAAQTSDNCSRVSDDVGMTETISCPLARVTTTVPGPTTTITVPGPTSTVTSTVTATVTQSVTPSATPTPTPTVTPTPTPSTTQPAGPFPTAATTGVPAGTTLTTVNGNLTTSANGQIIDAQRITGDLIVNHSGVKVTRTRILGRIQYQNSGLNLTDVDVGRDTCPASASPTQLLSGSNYSLTRVHMHHNGTDLLRFGGSGGTINVLDSLLDQTCTYLGEHLDAIQLYAPRSPSCACVTNATITHSSIDSRPVNAAGLGNAAIFWADFPGLGSTLTLTNSQLAGGNYTGSFYDATAGSRIVLDIRGNTFVNNSWNYGPSSCSNSIPFDGTSGYKWSANKLSTGTPISDC